MERYFVVEFRTAHLVKIDGKATTVRELAQMAYEQADFENNTEVVSVLETDKDGFTLTNEQLRSKQGFV